MKNRFFVASYIKYTDKPDDVTAIIEYRHLGMITGKAKEKGTTRLPVIVNSVDIEKGGELVLAKATNAKAVRRNEVILDCGLSGPSAKRPKQG